MGQLSPTDMMKEMESNVTNGFGTITRNGNTYTYTSGSKSSTPGQSTSWTMPASYSNPKYPDKSAQTQQPTQQQTTKYNFNGQTYNTYEEAVQAQQQYTKSQEQAQQAQQAQKEQEQTQKNEKWLEQTANKMNVTFVNDLNNNRTYYAYVNGKWTKANSETEANKMLSDYKTSQNKTNNQQQPATGNQIPFSGTLTEGKAYTDNQGRYYKYQNGQWQKVDQNTYNSASQKGIIAPQEGNWIESQIMGQPMNTTSPLPKTLNEMTPESAVNSDYRGGDNFVWINFTDDIGDAIYLYDKINKTYRKFQSLNAVVAFTKKSLQEVENSIQSAPTSIMSLPEWSGQTLDEPYTVKEDGTAAKEPTPTESVSGLKSLYGLQRQSVDVENFTAKEIDGAMKFLKTNGAISQQTYDLLKNPAVMAKYINARLYGGYALGDIFRDLKAKELATNGNSTYSNVKTFDETVPASQWYNTEEAQRVLYDSNLSIPSGLDVDIRLFNNKIFQVPPEAYKTLSQPLQWDSPELKAEAEKIQAAWYDISMQIAEADTEQKRAVALGNWEKFRKDLGKKYGIQLSNDAKAAWGQLRDMFNNYSNRGIQQSGLFNEVMDNYLSDVRDNNQLLREGKLDEQNAEYRNYLLQNGTPEEIQAFITANPDKATAWGLVPSDEKKQWFSLENLKSVYPNMSDDEIQRVHDMILDENGNYRSELYRNLYTNKYNLSEQKKAYQEDMAIKLSKQKEEKAYAPFTQTSGFSSNIPAGSYWTDIVKKETSQIPSANKSVQESTDVVKPILPNVNVGNQYPSTKLPEPPPQQQMPQQNAPTAGQQNYTVKLGDSLSKIAGTLGVPMQDIKNANPDKIKDINKIKEGDVFIIPTKAVSPTTPQASQPTASNSLSQAAQAAGQIGTNSKLKVVSNYNPKNYSGASVVDYLKSIGYGSDLTTRQNLAKDYGMTTYDYTTGVGNTELLKKMRGY